jgi:hypothetical protein
MELTSITFSEHLIPWPIYFVKSEGLTPANLGEQSKGVLSPAIFGFTPDQNQ